MSVTWYRMNKKMRGWNVPSSKIAKEIYYGNLFHLSSTRLPLPQNSGQQGKPIRQEQRLDGSKWTSVKEIGGGLCWYCYNVSQRLATGISSTKSWTGFSRREQLKWRPSWKNDAGKTNCRATFSGTFVPNGWWENGRCRRS